MKARFNKDFCGYKLTGIEFDIHAKDVIEEKVYYAISIFEDGEPVVFTENQLLDVAEILEEEKENVDEFGNSESEQSD